MSVMSKNRRVSIVLGLLWGLALLVPGAAWASDYPLENVLPKDAAEKLSKQGVTTTTQLLDKAAKGKARRALAKTTGIALKKLQEWVELADMVRIKGVGPKMTALLRAGGVKTVAKLKGQRAKTLLARMLKANKKKMISENPPNEAQVANWIGQAKKLPLVLK